MLKIGAEQGCYFDAPALHFVLGGLDSLTAGIHRQIENIPIVMGCESSHNVEPTSNLGDVESS